MRSLVAFLVVTVAICGLAAGQAQLNTLYSFSGSPDGSSPVDKLVFDKAGNLYGTTEWGGANGWGSVFELPPNGGGTWTESTTYSFCQQANCSDGSNPLAALILDAAGNLYGTTNTGGGPKCPPGGDGCGTVFELSPPLLPGGAWTESVLYDFCQIPGDENCMDGAKPSGKLIFDATGNLYSAVSSGAGGVVFELSQSLKGWTESILYTFCVHGELHCINGKNPVAGVAFDKSGNLYGTTSAGGSKKYEGGGVVYKLTPGSNGWTEEVLYAFLSSFGPKGGYLLGEVNFDPTGNIYSTAYQGGQDGQGTVFRLTPKGGLQTLSFDGSNGAAPAAGVLIDPRNGALYGTTSGGTQYPGTVFQILHGKLNVLAQFNVGTGPTGALISDNSGHLYGTTKGGGDFGMGSVFEITP